MGKRIFCSCMQNLYSVVHLGHHIAYCFFLSQVDEFKTRALLSVVCIVWYGLSYLLETGLKCKTI